MLTTRLWRWSGLRHGLRIGRPRFARSTWAIVEGTPRSSSDASGHRSASETASGRQNTPAQVADDSALRECHESRGTRYSEGHSAHNDAAVINEGWSQLRVGSAAEVTGPRPESFVLDEPLFECPSPKPAEAEGEVVGTCEQVVGKRLHHEHRQFALSNRVAEQRECRRDADGILFGNRAGHPVVEYRLEATRPSKREDSALSEVLLPDSKSLLVFCACHQEGHVVAPVDADPVRVEDLAQNRQVV